MTGIYPDCPVVYLRGTDTYFSLSSYRVLVGVVGIEIASLFSKSNKDNGVASPPRFNWSLLEPRDIMESSGLDNASSRLLDHLLAFQ
jgi:hypothetical protein